MRYIINDDDLEDWYSILYQLNQTSPDHALDYVLDEMEKEIMQNIPIQNKDSFLSLLQKKKP